MLLMLAPKLNIFSLAEIPIDFFRHNMYVVDRKNVIVSLYHTALLVVLHHIETLHGFLPRR